jgi:pimeloyl-ACP methyl ester carboxylesterase
MESALAIPEIQCPEPEKCPGPVEWDFAEVQNLFANHATRSRFHTGRYRCSYFTLGQGPPLIFIPGLLDAARSFHLPIYLLHHHFTCIAYDLPTGQGDEARLNRYGHDDLVADLEILADHLNLRSAFLYGSSFGSTMALRAMANWPGRFVGGVMQGGFAKRPLAPAEVLLAHFARYWPGTMGQLPGFGRLLKHSHFGPFASKPTSFWQALVEQYFSPPMAAVAYRALILHGLDLRSILPRIRQPILLICGDRDPLVGKPCEEELMQGLPRVSRVEIPNCGHMPQFSHPEAVAELAEHFLYSII